MGQRHRGHILPRDEHASRVAEPGDVIRSKRSQLRAPREGEPPPPGISCEGGRDLRKPRATATQEDPRRQELTLREIADHQLDAVQPDRSVCLKGRLQLVPRDRGFRKLLPVSSRHLERLGAREGQRESLGQTLGEGAATQREHLGAGDAPVSHERHVGCSATDVDENGARVPQLPGCQACRHGVRLGDHAQ